jgi:hypothetical protein
MGGACGRIEAAVPSTTSGVGRMSIGLFFLGKRGLAGFGCRALVDCRALATRHER